MSIVGILCITTIAALGAAAAIFFLIKLNSYVRYLADGLASWRIQRPGQSSLSGGIEREFMSRDGVPLTGTYFHSRIRKRGILMFVHDVEGNRASVKDYLEPLLDSGYDVFAFDLRGTNGNETSKGSGYRPFWVIKSDLNDVLGCVDLLCREYCGEAGQIGALGISCGGAAVLAAAAMDHRIAAVATDGSFAFEELLIHHVRRLINRKRKWKWKWVTDRMPDLMLCALAKLAIRRIWRGRHEQYLNSRLLLRRLKQPTLLIQGEKDTLVPVDQAHSLHRLIRNSRLWIVAAAKHNNAIRMNSFEYIDRLTSFMGQNLQATTKRRLVAPARYWIPDWFVSSWSLLSSRP